MKIRILSQAGEDPEELWRRHVYAYVKAGMCPRDGQPLDAYGRCRNVGHGRWTIIDDGWQWAADLPDDELW